MNPSLLAAAAALLGIGLEHSVMGERRIFRLWRAQPPQALRRHHAVLVRASWHLPSLLGLGQAGALLVLGLQADGAVAPTVQGPLLLALAAGTGACGALVALVTRGRHLGGLALLATAALILTGR